MEMAIVNYGAGNTANVKNAFEKLGSTARISSSVRTWKAADALVLPGVGAFGSAMCTLGDRRTVLTDLLRGGKPFLGICLGMQLLLDSSEESPGIAGLGLVSGTVRRFRTALPIPQMGWNRVEALPSPLFDGLSDFYAYFVHSYYCQPTDPSVVAATTDYGGRFAAVLATKNLFATQFHPEKSGESGLRVLQNFIGEVKK